MSAPVWSHVALNCRDQGTTETFYRDVLGFRRARVVPLGGTRIVFLRLGGALLELFDAEPAGAPAGPAAPDGPHAAGVPRHLAFQTDDLDAFLAGPGAGVPVSLGPLAFDDVIPGWRSVWLLDPDGVVVEVSQGYRDQGPAETDPEHTEEPPDE